MKFVLFIYKNFINQTFHFLINKFICKHINLELLLRDISLKKVTLTRHLCRKNIYVLLQTAILYLTNNSTYKLSDKRWKIFIIFFHLVGKINIC